jgi:hypothetical protein
MTGFDVPPLSAVFRHVEPKRHMEGCNEPQAARTDAPRRLRHFL